MRFFASWSRDARKDVGSAAAAAAAHLSDRATVGLVLLARLEALQAEHAALGPQARPPRLRRRWAPRLYDAQGHVLRSTPEVTASWAEFVPVSDKDSADAETTSSKVRIAALRTQASYGRLPL